MAEQDEFFVPEEVDRQIERVSQFKEGDRRDAEALAYLRSFYQADAQQEQETLDRIWNRIAGATRFELKKVRKSYLRKIHKHNIVPGLWAIRTDHTHGALR